MDGGNSSRVRLGQRVGWLFGRAFWAGMLALHLGPILAGFVLSGKALALDAAGILRLAMLLASAAFFAFKFADVSWLRLRPGWRSAVVSAMIVALLHLSAVDRAIGTDFSSSPERLTAVLLTGGLVSAEFFARRVRRLFAWPVGARPREGQSVTLCLDGCASPSILCIQPLQRCYASPRALRAPPLA